MANQLNGVVSPSLGQRDCDEAVEPKRRLGNSLPRAWKVPEKEINLGKPRIKWGTIHQRLELAPGVNRVASKAMDKHHGHVGVLTGHESVGSREFVYFN